MAPLRLRDDRDRPVPIRIAPPRVRRPTLRLRALTVASVRVALARSARVLLSGPAILTITGVVFATEIIGLLIAQGPTGLYVALASPVAVVLLALLLIVARAVWLAPGWAAGLSAEASLSRSRCPSCGYDLGATEPSPGDGRVVCAECGAAWDGWRVGASASEAAERVVIIRDWPAPGSL